MIQATFTAGVNKDNYIYLRLSDVNTSTIDNTIRPLISIKSQQTEKILNFMATTVTVTNAARYTEMKYYTTDDPALDLPVIGYLIVGNNNYPFGFYDVTIYQNSSNVNLDSTGLTTTLYTGLLNLTSTINPTQYNQYTTNDTDTASVYITN
jgi:hypothetical protein